jgi:quercetin dioxygenase-like cupin family protein
MPGVSKDSATQHHDYGPIEDWSQDIDGYTINFAAFKVEIDSTPMLKGLPGDRCSCPHWGYVLKGRVVFTFEDREDVHEAGDAFYVPAGHLQRAEAGTEYVQFSPADELRIVSETIASNMAKMHGA